MTVLFGAHGMAAALTAETAHLYADRMGRRAAVTTTPEYSAVVTTTIAADGLVFGVTGRQSDGSVAPSPAVQDAGLRLVMQGGLHNRAELAKLLGLSATDGAAGDGAFVVPASDAVLALAAYRRFGTECVEHFVGDWVIALWDAARQTLLLARDATGNSALFWWQGGGQFLFATSLPTLLSAGPVPARPNPRWLAGLLTVFTDPAHPGATGFESVFSVPPGHLLRVAGGHVALTRWWRPEVLPPLDGVPLPELQERFLSIYTDAVRESLQRHSGTVAATLSGGLDSGSVVAFAAPMLAGQGQRLTGYVHTPRFAAADGPAMRTQDEWPLAQSTARFVGQVDAVACPTAHLSPVDGIERWLDMAAVPSHAAQNWYWLLDIAQRASAAGATVLLTGQAGNSTVSFAGTGAVWRLLRHAGLAAVLRELAAEETGWTGAIRDRLVKPTLRPVWHACRSAQAAAMSRTPGWHELGLLRPGLADSLNLDAAMRSAGHDPRLNWPSRQRWQQFRLSLMDGADNGLATWSALGIAHGLSIRDPTRDRRVVEFCWRLPDEIFWAHGRRRGLVRDGMRGRLPPEVLECSRKGLQSSDIHDRLRDCRDGFLSRVDEVCRHPVARDWIDTERLLASSQAALDGGCPTTAGTVAVGHVLRALAVGMFVVRRA